MGLPPFVALNDPRHGRLVEAQKLGNPALPFAFHLDPLEDEMGVAIGFPGLAGAGVVSRQWAVVSRRMNGGNHGKLLGKNEMLKRSVMRGRSGSTVSRIAGRITRKIFL